MIESLISSKTRIKLLLRFFLNSDMSGYLRGLEQEFGDSSNAIRLELNRFEDSGLLKSSLEGNKKVYKANREHPLYEEVNSIIRKYVGIDQIIDKIVEKLGTLKAVYLVGSLAEGINSSIIDLIIVGVVDKPYLDLLINKVEKLINKRIRFIIYEDVLTINWSEIGEHKLLLWEQGG